MSAAHFMFYNVLCDDIFYKKLQLYQLYMTVMLKIFYLFDILEQMLYNHIA